ncbi:hypothetical protein I4U23_011093 [Adineta vaga]|nr:hypothetical protein I4U23_011093 [Adineta vaga]
MTVQTTYTLLSLLAFGCSPTMVHTFQDRMHSEGVDATALAIDNTPADVGVKYLFLRAWRSPHIIVAIQNSAFCYLTYRPTPELLEFAQEFAEDAIKYGVEIFIMIDDNKYNFSSANVSSNVRLLQMSSEKCLQHNYQKAINTGGTWRSITSWDKSLLYFSVLNQNYSFVWLSEEDVFIPHVEVFRSLHQLYSNSSDLIVPHHTVNYLGSDGTWFWPMATGKFLPPWSASMVNIVGLSRRMLKGIDDFVQWLGEVPFHEFFFNTLVLHLNFTIVVPLELNTVEYANAYLYEDVRARPNNLWHPIKDHIKAKKWRQNLTNESLQYNYTFEWSHLQKLCDKSDTIKSMEAYFNDTLLRFEKIKRQLSINMHHLWRKRFIGLAQKCQKQNASQQLISFVSQLADHAYKLPEPLLPNLVNRKSAEHIKLEREINETKRAIYQFTTNSSTVTDLRRHAGGLIRKLRWEIRREYFEEEKLRNQTTTTTLSSSSTTNTNISRRSLTIKLITASIQVNTTTRNRQFEKVHTHDDYQLFDRIKNSTKIFVEASGSLVTYKFRQSINGFVLNSEYAALPVNFRNF